MLTTPEKIPTWFCARVDIERCLGGAILEHHDHVGIEVHGKITRWDRRSRQVQDVSPVPLRTPGYRVIRTQPVVFSPADPRTLYFASNTVWKTRDGGRNWQRISPDLTRRTWEVPGNVGKYRGSEQARPEQRGVVYALAPSPKDAGVIWAGSDDGLIHRTRDGGKSWQDVTPQRHGS